MIPTEKTLRHIYEPTPLSCGQAVLAMLAGVSVQEIIGLLKTERETTLRQMLAVLAHYGIPAEEKRVPVQQKNDLPGICFLSLETPKCWHWSLYFHGTFYDPEYGVCEDFPPSARRYYWKIGD